MVSQKYGPFSQANISRTEPPISFKVRSSFPLISLFQIHPTDPQHFCAHFIYYYIPPGYTNPDPYVGHDQKPYITRSALLKPSPSGLFSPTCHQSL